MNSVLDSPNPHRLMSLASRIKAIHRALTAEELAELLQVARITILRRAKRAAYRRFEWVLASDSTLLQSPSG
jgi:hypothetical protein